LLKNSWRTPEDLMEKLLNATLWANELVPNIGIH